jgi:hypothetical protein
MKYGLAFWLRASGFPLPLGPTKGNGKAKKTAEPMIVNTLLITSSIA